MMHWLLLGSDAGRHDWVLDLDVRSFFDEIDWELLMRAVRHHTDCAWVLLYIDRWLRAPVCMPDGALENREKGSPQGSVVSPILANLFLHYRSTCGCSASFRHVRSSVMRMMPSSTATARIKLANCWTCLQQRFAECKLELSPQKTKIVYCKDANRPGNYPEQNFDFLGHTFGRVGR